MKASNVKVMVQANRLLVHRMMEEGMNYPIHLGVTEAGDTEDGRIKSVAGIGPLLLDGIGDTIRVSLTEDPEFEMPVAKEIVARFNDGKKRRQVQSIASRQANPFNYTRRMTEQVEKIGSGQVPVVIVSDETGSFSTLSDNETIPDYFYLHKSGNIQGLKVTKKILQKVSCKIDFQFIDSVQSMERSISKIKPETVLILNPDKDGDLRRSSVLIELANQKGINPPIILFRDYEDMSLEKVLVHAATDFSYFLVDGLIDGILIDHKSMKLTDLSRLAFGILQATGSRITKTEYIACPSCGRTLFNIQETLQKIKSRTSHLKGLKIGVMGCCVNGPGEMADADYGYVGAGKGKITLYKGREVIKTGIPEQNALDYLMKLIKQNGDWK
jgi:(E)-4-hydroxy-3-methylbut-2-enyl-diphosphate synthase